jgi:hypothetical protein
MFAHEKLQVYGKALDFVAKSAAWTTLLGKAEATAGKEMLDRISAMISQF